MNLNQIANMGLRIFVRKVIHLGMNTGFKKLAKVRKAEAEKRRHDD